MEKRDVDDDLKLVFKLKGVFSRENISQDPIDSMRSHLLFTLNDFNEGIENEELFI